MFFISNSLPKSGSSLMFNYQRLLLQKLYSTDFRLSYMMLSRMLGKDCMNGFIPPSCIKELENILMNKEKLELISPSIVKTHAAHTTRFSKYIRESNDIHSSLCIRDPHEILISAMINHKKRPQEFKYFSNPILGSLRITSYYYQKIYRSFARTATNCNKTNLIHYEVLKKDPQEALFKSMENLLLMNLHNTDEIQFKRQAIAMVKEIVSSSEVHNRVRYRITSTKDKRSYRLLPLESFISSLILFLPRREFKRILKQQT